MSAEKRADEGMEAQAPGAAPQPPQPPQPSQPPAAPPGAAQGSGCGQPPQSAPAEAPAPAQTDFYEQLLRLKAEFENYRKRVDRERPEWIQNGRAGLLNKLLPLYDALLQAHEQVAMPGADGASKDIAKGLGLIFKEFTKVFESEGVRPIETVGKPYDYDRHEALGSVETGAHPEGTVVEELQRGYLLNGKVLRPARVRIAKAPPAEEKAKQTEPQKQEKPHKHEKKEAST